MYKNNDIITALAEQIANVLMASGSLENCVASTEEIKYYTVDELCEMLHISKATYYRHKDLGLIKPTVYVGRKPLFDKQAIDSYLQKFQI